MKDQSKAPHIRAKRPRSVEPSLAAPSASGQYIALYESGRLEELIALLKRYAQISPELQNVEIQLADCNDRHWLQGFSQETNVAGKNFVQELRTLARRLEERKAQLLSEKLDLQKQIETLDPNAIAAPSTQAIANTLASSPGSVNQSKQDPKVRVRDLTIYKYRMLSNLDICRRLDGELMLRENPPIGFPDSWIEDCGVRTYVEAYEHSQCRNRVQKLISTVNQRLQIT